MSAKNDPKANIIKAINCLESESLEAIDFDVFSESLQELLLQLDSYERTTAELNYLKSDYRNRIFGMQKAIMACKGGLTDHDQVVRLNDDFENINAEEMITLYQKTAVRFRKCFPASFKYLTANYGQTTKSNNWTEYKL